MTQTLTTERQQFEQWWHEEYCHLEGSSEAAFVKHVAWEAMKKARELLDNREAQPVAWASTASLKRGDIREVWPNGEQHKAGKLCITALYTAPPAPAVPEEMSGITPYCHGWNECRAAMLAQPQNVPQNIPNNIPDGCHWAYDEHDYKWGSGCGEAWMFSDGGPVENGVKFCQSCGKPVLLAAAPEGGNG